MSGVPPVVPPPFAAGVPAFAEACADAFRPAPAGALPFFFALAAEGAGDAGVDAGSEAPALGPFGVGLLGVGLLGVKFCGGASFAATMDAAPTAAACTASS